MGQTRPAGGRARQYDDDAFADVDERVAYYKRTNPPRPGGTGFIYPRGMSATVAAMFRRYCQRHGYKIAHAIEFLMRDAVERDRLLDISRIKVLDE